MLLKEFLEPMGTTQVAFATRLGVPLGRLNQIIRGKRAISAETALLLARELGTSPLFWMNAQNMMDLYYAAKKLGVAPAPATTVEPHRARRVSKRSKLHDSAIAAE
jgi:addiction module HigA family antidote